MMKILQSVGNFFATIFIRSILFLYGLVTRFLYLSKTIYVDKAVKQQIKQGAILICNHQAHMDGFYIPQILSRYRPYVLVTRKWYDKKKVAPFFHRTRYIPINLDEPDNTWIEMAEAVLKSGHSVIIFPEGRLEENHIPLPFHSGCLLPAKHLDIPVIPMAICGNYKAFHRQLLIIGKPLDLNLQTPGRLSLILKNATAVCEKAVFELRDRYMEK